MANVENSLVSIFTVFPKYVIFTPKYGQSVLGHTIRDFLGSMEIKVGCERERESIGGVGAGRRGCGGGN